MSSSLVIPRSDLGKGLRALGHCLCHPGAAFGRLSRGLAGVYRDQVSTRSPLPEVPLAELVDPQTAITLSDFVGRDGNVSLFELTVISSLVAARRPKVTLEIGTFDGNTTLQIANNAPADAVVYTLDLPAADAAAAALDPHDVSYIDDTAKLDRKYARAASGTKVVQCLGDSATFDFGSILEKGALDLVFIDGSHSYDYVKRDTETILEFLAADGVALWHDYVPAWPGVIEYLSALGCDLPLRRIAGTSMVVLDRAAGS